MEIWTCEGVIAHSQPHLDEYAAGWLLARFGGLQFPGIDSASLSTWGTGGLPPDGRSAQSWVEDGYVLLGIGRSDCPGCFDEHPGPGYAGKPEECVTSLAAEYLGLKELPELKQLLEYVIANDVRGVAGKMDLNRAVQELNQQFPNDPETVKQWVRWGLDKWLAVRQQFGPVEIPKGKILTGRFELNALAKELKRVADSVEVDQWVAFAEEAHQRSQAEFVQAKEEYPKQARQIQIAAPGRSIIMAVVESDNPKMVAACRHNGAQFVVIRQSTGHTQILAKPGFNFPMAEVAKALRLLEQQAAGEALVTDPVLLVQEGRLEQVPEWFYFPGTSSVMNGSRSATDVMPTKLSLATIRAAVEVALSAKLHPDCPVRSCAGAVCSWYQFGLSRCQAIQASAA